MRPMTKFLNILGPILIIALLALLAAEPYYRASSYWVFLILSFLSMLVVWVGMVFLLKISFAAPRVKGFFWKITVAWTAASIIGWFVNQILLSRLVSGFGDRSFFLIPLLIMTWIFGLLLVLGWHVGIALLHLIFTSAHLGWLKVVVEVIFSLILLVAAIVVLINLQIRIKFRGQITSVEEVESSGTVIVFGAGVYQEAERPSQVLRDRIEMAAQLVASGKSESVILSGDGSENSVEVDVMERYSVEVGIPEAFLIRDNAGVRTFETCFRASTEFGVTDAILVTQNFHLPRALFLCDSFGIQAVGVRADQTRYSILSQMIWALRESLATAYAWLEVSF